MRLIDFRRLITVVAVQSTLEPQLTNGSAGAMAFTLANSTTYLSNRSSLPANFFLANPNLNFARYTSNASHSTYNSLQVDARRRFSEGLFVQANYTFSKSLTDSEGAGNEPYRTLRNPGLDKHRASFDVTHTFNAGDESSFGPRAESFAG